jgi:hypothetical protein
MLVPLPWGARLLCNAGFQSLPNVAAGLLQSVPRFARIGARYEHHERYGQIVLRLTQRLFR